MKRDRHKHNGWTLLEVAMGIVVCGILSAVVYGRYLNVNTNLISQCTAIKTHLRFAQLKAMNTSAVWGIRFNQSAYQLFNAEDIDRPVFLPGAETDQIDLSACCSISLQPDDNSSNELFFVAFDSLGRPGVALADNQLDPNREDLHILVSDRSGVNSQTILITAETGFIP